MTVQPTRDQLRALADAATPGPWEERGYKEMPGKYVVGPRKPGDLARGPVVLMEPLFCDERSAADAEFIVAARTAVPQLLDQLDQAKAERDRWHSMWRQRGVKRLAAEKRATRAEAQAAIRGRAVVMYRERAREAEARIKAVRELHRSDGHDPDVCVEPGCFASCVEDSMEWPCDTIRALESVPPPSA